MRQLIHSADGDFLAVQGAAAVFQLKYRWQSRAGECGNGAGGVHVCPIVPHRGRHALDLLINKPSAVIDFGHKYRFVGITIFIEGHGSDNTLKVFDRTESVHDFFAVLGEFLRLIGHAHFLDCVFEEINRIVDIVVVHNGFGRLKTPGFGEFYEFIDKFLGGD